MAHVDRPERRSPGIWAVRKRAAMFEVLWPYQGRHAWLYRPLEKPGAFHSSQWHELLVTRDPRFDNRNLLDLVCWNYHFRPLCALSWFNWSGSYDRSGPLEAFASPVPHVHTPYPSDRRSAFLYNPVPALYLSSFLAQCPPSPLAVIMASPAGRSSVQDAEERRREGLCHHPSTPHKL